MRTGTLVVNRSDARCGECGRPAKPSEPSHQWGGSRWPDDPATGCGIAFTHVTSDYGDFGGLHDSIRRLRPDLIWEPSPWENMVREP